ncbi:MAG: hypothetical protein Q4D51_12145 [Eubacteriales bacterium]|nr:hypothetical protein [Eubacteriales bacterium]
MARRSIEDVMNEIEDFLNSCSTKALSSNKVIVPRDEFDELFGDLKVKIPAEIDRCKKIMRNKEAILMDARKTADGIIAEASTRAQQMVSETEIMAQANQTAYETVEMARVQANDILAQAVAQANEIRLGSMQYTNDMMLGLRNYVEATIEAERANYENLIQMLNNDYKIADANLTEIQNQIVEFTGNPNSVTRAPKMKTVKSLQTERREEEAKPKTSMMDKVKHAMAGKEEKEEKKSSTPNVELPDFIASGEKVVPNETPLESKKPVAEAKVEAGKANVQEPKKEEASQPAETNTQKQKKVKKIVKKKNPVMHTPQTAQETVAKTLEAAAAAKTDKTVYKANGEQAREIPPMEGRVKRGPRVGRNMVEESVHDSLLGEDDSAFEVTTQPMGKSMGVVDDYSMPDKI